MATYHPTTSRGEPPTSLRSIRVPALPRREREILVLVEAGHTSVEIADRLGLSPRSVDSAVERTRQRLGAKTRLHAAMLGHLANTGPTDADALGERPAPTLDIEIDDDLRALIVGLCEGATVAVAASDIGMSRRTASRRLAELRDLLGVESTARAIVLAAHHLGATTHAA